MDLPHRRRLRRGRTGTRVKGGTTGPRAGRWISTTLGIGRRRLPHLRCLGNRGTTGIGIIAGGVARARRRTVTAGTRLLAGPLLLDPLSELGGMMVDMTGAEGVIMIEGEQEIVRSFNVYEHRKWDYTP